MRERIKKINQLIKEEFSWIILREVEFPFKVYVTLTRAETSANLIDSKVYISVIPEDKTDQVLKILNKQIYRLQQKLNKRLDMRPVPKISFTKEKETVAAGRVEEILEQLKKKK